MSVHLTLPTASNTLILRYKSQTIVIMQKQL